MRNLLACCILLCSNAFTGQAQDCGSVVLTINAHGQEGTIGHHQLAQADSLVFMGADCNRLFRVYTLSCASRTGGITPTATGSLMR